MPVLSTLAGVVGSFAIPGGVDLERRDGAGVDDDGDPVDGTLTVLNITPGIIQTASGDVMLRVPEGDRSRETILIHTNVLLRTAEEGTGREADVVLYTSDGDTAQQRFTVTTSGDWGIIAGFYSCLAQRQEGP